jgi:hypothetical protein
MIRMDDEIVNDMFERFPELKFEDALRNLDEDQMKSKAGKEKWRNFILPVSQSHGQRGYGVERQYEGKVNEYNFGTLIRKDADKLYAEDNTILVTRVQFFAIEVSHLDRVKGGAEYQIARNRAGINDKVYNEAQAQKNKS